MVKKKIAITILMLCLVFSSLHAIENEPSVFELSVVNGYKLDHLVDADFNAYTPSLRVQFNIVEWFGMGMGVMYQYPYDTITKHTFTLATDIVFKLPIGIFEPYVAFGPNYLFTLDNSNVFSFINTVGYDFRLGFDFDITSWFTLGIEGKLLASDLVGLFSNLAGLNTTWLLENTFVALVLKTKL
ncbi:MAG: hypothetical protein RBT04_01730 [Sphaerochaetaceae bacterium]|jgi:hypothetical protein|nr:hypothetical protein [Sphaerochaetaceae bacterium]